MTAESKTLEDDALIDAIARLRERGIRAGLSVSGAGQDVAIRRSLDVRRDGERVFDSVQAAVRDTALLHALDIGVGAPGCARRGDEGGREGGVGERAIDS